MTEIKKYLSVQLRAARKRKGFSQETLAELAGLSTPFVSEMERAVANPTLETLVKISSILGVPLAVLLDVEGAVGNDDYMRRLIAENLPKMQGDQLKILLMLSRLNEKK